MKHALVKTRMAPTNLEIQECFLPILDRLFEPGSKLLVLGMVIQPLIVNPYNGYINPYYWVDDHPLLYGNIGGLDPIAHVETKSCGDQTQPFNGLVLVEDLEI